MIRPIQLNQIVNPKIQNKINRSIIFHYIRENGPVSRIKVSKELKISAPAVSRVINKLIENKFLVEIGKIKTKSGKRPILLKINENKGHIIAIDLSTEELKIAITNFSGKIIKKYQGFRITNSKDIEKKLIDKINKVIKEFYQKSQRDGNNSKIEAICVGVAANIDTTTGKILSVPLYESWIDINFKKILNDAFKIPVYVEEDIFLSVLAEKKYGEGKKYDDIIFIEVSIGIGAGIIIDNHIIKGSSGLAGQIGFIITNPKDIGYNSNNRGYLENFASIQSMKRIAIERIKQGEHTIITRMANNDVNKIDATMICNAAIKGDELANDIITETVNLLSIAIINLILIINPQIIVIGGEICNLPEVNRLFIKPIIENVKKSIPFKIPAIKLFSLGEDANLLGASFLGIEALVLGSFPYK